MLVLTVKFGETVQIGDGIFITPLRPTNLGKGVRVGVDAPEDVVIVRNELLERYTLTEQAEISPVVIDC